MILIKDRHTMFLMNSMVAITGKYDTYKGWLDSGLKFI